MKDLTLSSIANILHEFEEWIIEYDDDTAHLRGVGKDAALLWEAGNWLERMNESRKFDFTQFLREREEKDE